MVRGARRSLSIALLVGASGCSVLYDPDRLQDRADAAVDGRSLDAEPLSLTGIETGLLEEGAGLGGSRPAVVRVLGTGMTNATMFRASWQGSGETLEIVEREVSADGRAAALAFAVEVDPTLSSGARTLVIGLGGNSASETVQAEVAMLPELTTQAPAAPFEYSMIHITNATHIPGAIGPLVLRSASSITLDARYDVDAGDDLGGRGACVEGPSCPGGGKPGTGGFGGGGGGFGGAGGQGEGFGQGGAGGPAVGDPMMIPFGAGPNRGHLGGVGFDGNGGDAQPGGGGGALALWSEGDVTLGPVGALSAAGGAGKPGLRVPSGGGGGGGSGGAVMIHAGGTLHARAGSIDCPGGAGGRDQYDGGDGGQGRVRIDAGMLEGIAGPLVDDLVGGGVPYRGPAFARETPLVTSTATTDLQALGPPQTMMALTAPGGVRSAMTDAAGSVRFLDVPTPSGVHRLCVTVAGAADDPLGRACLYLAAP